MPSPTSSPPEVPPAEAEECPVDECCRPEFIFGGPFIKAAKIEPFLNTGTPINVQLQGTFKRSYAFFTLKERLPVILTKVIDFFSRGKAKAAGASPDDEQAYIQFVAKLKSDLMTNKTYEPFKIDTEEGKKWNSWIENQDNKHYFTNIWLFTECYLYRKLWEGCELYKSLANVDYFSEMKEEAFNNSLGTMCLVADKVTGMLPVHDKDERKADFVTLLKLCLWANKCDLSLTAGKAVTLGGAPDPDKPLLDPFQMILDSKDKLLVDDSGKIADAIPNKAEAVKKAIEGITTFKFQCSCHRLATAQGMPLAKGEETEPPPPEAPEGGAPLATDDANPPEPPKIPCPAKMVVAQTPFFDIVCDNAGYELFTDLCLAHFLISQEIVEKVRFHVKKMPWFVSDVTPRDFDNVISMCVNASYNRTVEPEPKPVPAGTEPPPPEPAITITSANVKALATQWKTYAADGKFIVMAEDYWTYPHPYKDMKKIDYNMYRKLQYAVGILFKGDLNYRKLLGEKNWVPTTGFEASLQGFIPAPIIACRTVKSELISGLPKGKYEAITKIDEKWREKGIYGTIQYCAKAEALKVADRPCIDYGTTCFSELCLWANKCDLSLTAGKAVTLGGAPDPDKPLLDPFQMILDSKDKLLVDDSGKIADAIPNKAEAVKKAIEGEAEPPPPEAPEGGAPPATDDANPPEPPKIPCPAKMVVAQTPFFDIVCDNAGYELFTDLCLAHFLISQEIVEKVRFHVKKMPWFVSDVTPRDFDNVISMCVNASYNRTVEPEPKPVHAGTEPPPPEPAITITSANVKALATQWKTYAADGKFIVMAEDYWTYPHPYKDMKKIDYNMYRKLQYAVGILFKGDLNYRKLLGEKNWVPTTGFEASLQGFIPAPIIACRTVKSELISGLPKGKYEAITKIDEKWREKGTYGTIQYCAKAEALKVADRPCIDYGTTCFSKVCPVHTDM